MLPADHIIRDTASMLNVISDSVEVAAKDGIVTIGIGPGFPSTGYGYIHCGEELETATGTRFYKSLGFKEKPDIATAKEFLKDKSYKWNSGMFIWSLKTIYTAFRKFVPSMADKIDILAKAFGTPDFQRVFAATYQSFEKISIDYAIMEKAENVSVAQGTFDWDDVGSWTALRNQIRPEENNNVVRGLYQGIDTKNCVIVGDSKHLIATVDVEDLIVVHTDDATLVCNAKSAQKIKDLVRILGSNAELSKFT
jgi:mannose-1-phosphate guanylyltransferase